MAAEVKVVDFKVSGVKRANSRVRFTAVFEEVGGEYVELEIRFYSGQAGATAIWDTGYYPTAIGKYGTLTVESPYFLLPRDYTGTYYVWVDVINRDTRARYDTKYITFNVESETIPEEPEIVPEEVPEEVPEVPLPPEEIPAIPIVIKEVDVPPEIPVEELPWYLSWLRPLIDVWNDTGGKWVKDIIDGWNGLVADLGRRHEAGIKSLGMAHERGMENLGKTFGPIDEFFRNPVGSLVSSVMGSQDKIIGEAEVQLAKESLNPDRFKTPQFKQIVNDIREVLSSTPQNIHDFTDSTFGGMWDTVFKEIELIVIPEPPVDFEKARQKQKDLFRLTSDFWLLATLLDIVATAVSATMVRNLCHHARNVIAMFDFGQWISLVSQPALKYGVTQELEYGFAEKFKPLIPPYQDLINMRVKEVLEEKDFDKWIGKQGYNKYWSKNIWDAHFIAPGLNDLLTSWRRGNLTDDELYRLQVLVDLDPRYDNIWEDRRYIDPSRTEARFMYELGVTDRAGVEDILKRQGYMPEDITDLADYITLFPERRMRYRKLTALMSGVIAGVVEENELREGVFDIYPHNPKVADIILDMVDIRKRIAEAKVKPKDKVKTLSLSQIRKGYLDDKIDEDLLPERLVGYDNIDQTVLINLLKAEKERQAEGRPVRYLTPAQILTAMSRYALTEEGRTKPPELTPEEIEEMEPTESELVRMAEIRADLLRGIAEGEGDVDWETRRLSLEAEYEEFERGIKSRRLEIESWLLEYTVRLREGEGIEAKRLLLERGLDEREADILITSKWRKG